VTPRHRPVSLGPTEVDVTRRPDGAVAGEGRSELAILVVPAAGFSAEAFRDRLAGFESTGSSDRIARALILTEPPSLDAGEITDKGTINQRAVLARRRHLVDQLYGDELPGVLVR
jgi:feruloyl-CoA synthase